MEKNADTENEFGRLPPNHGSKKDTLWRTALIITELEDELRLQPELGPQQLELARLETESEAFEEEITALRLKIAALEAALDDDPERPRAEVEELSFARRGLRLAFDARRKQAFSAGERLLGSRVDLHHAARLEIAGDPPLPRRDRIGRSNEPRTSGASA